jgi:TetR/AcrR family transcriptional regulator, transcriptional repressor for nem operon
MVYPQTHRNLLRIPFLKAGCPVLNTSVDADDTHPLLREKAKSALKLWRSSVVRIIEKGIETKEIRSEVNSNDFATILMSLTEGAVMQAKVTGKSAELDVTMDFLVKLIRDLKR